MFIGLYVLAFSAAHLALESTDHNDFGKGLQATPVSVVVILVSLAAVVTLYFLVAYHLRLISQNITTNEDFKLSQSPYDQGCARNWVMALFGARPPSRLLSREILRDGIHPSNRTLINVNE